MTTFNQFKFEKTDNNSTITVEVKADGCQEIVDEFISFMRGCGFMDVNIYDAMENAVEEHTAYQEHINKAAKLGLHVPSI
jgi:predicted xylose isomerase-like sugar epimerase